MVDILIAIDKIKRKSSDLTLECFISSEDDVDIVLRNLEIIGEAVGQLLKYSDFLIGTDVEWRRIVDLRNLLIHGYFGVDLHEIYGIVQKKITELERDIINIAKTKIGQSAFLEAIEDAKADLAELFRHESVAYLEAISKQFK